MVFNSYGFILAFLPITLIIFYVLVNCGKSKGALIALVLASVVFYAFTDKLLTIFLIADIGVNYLLYIWIRKKRTRLVLIISLALNIGVLFVFKYLDFAITVFDRVFKADHLILELAVPMGISFITFQQIAFLVDRYRDDKEVSLTEHALLTSFFPHISQGPIFDTESFLSQLKEMLSANWTYISEGLFVFAVGLSKKVLFADRLGKAVDWGYLNPGELNLVSALFVSFAYTLQIYFDFSGYCDMAWGMARMFGLTIPQNFDSPYKAEGIGDFWKRWHITLTKFLTKYVYIPLGGNRKGKMRMLLNTLIVFLLSGFWHGANYTFILWGALHGVGMIIEKILRGEKRQHSDRMPVRVIKRIFTFLFVSFAWILFRVPSMSFLKSFIKGFAVVDNKLPAEIIQAFTSYAGIDLKTEDNPVPAFLFLILCFLIAFIPKNVYERLSKMKFGVLTLIITLLMLLVSIMSLSDVTTYIYQMF